VRVGKTVENWVDSSDGTRVAHWDQLSVVSMDDYWAEHLDTGLAGKMVEK
jgi:hypothetical protein